MKKNLKVILLTVAATSSLWVLAIVVFCWVASRQSSPKGNFGRMVVFDSKKATALVVEEFEQSFSGTHHELFRDEIPKGERRFYAVGVVEMPSAPKSK
jgi:hypothetical protein